MRKIGRPFEAGKSGNPGGRPRMPRDVVAAAKAHSLDMLNVLIQLARDPKTPSTARISAATAVLDRGHGRPTVSIATSHHEAAHMTDAELEAIARGEQADRMGDTRADGEPVH